MSWVYPTSEAAVTTRLGIESAFFTVSTVFLGGGLAFLAASPEPAWQGFVAVIGTWALLFAARRWRSPHPVVAVALLVAGGVLVWCLVQVAPDSGFTIMAAVIAVTGLGSNLDRWTGAVGTLLGFGIAQAALLLGPHGPLFELPALIVAVGVASYYTMLAVVRRSSRSVGARLDHAVLTDIAADERRAFELQTRTLVHDTILSELAAIASTPRPAPSPKALASIRSSLDAVRRAVAASPEIEPPSLEVQRLVERLGASGVTVSVTGDPAVLELLPLAARDAMLLAAHQALVNVSAHAGTDEAELSIIRSGASIVVTVVDNGVGFDEGAVPEDRFGFRESILGRVEAAGGSARILSSPGHGTSVILAFELAEAVS